MTGTYLLVALVITVAAALQALVGFGFGLVAAPLIGVLAPDLLPGGMTVIAIGQQAIVLLRERHLRGTLDGGGPLIGRDRSEILVALAGRIPGAVLGAILVVAVSTRALGVIVALSVVLALLLTDLRPALPGGMLVVLGAGLVSGVLGTATTIGGPPIAAVWRSNEYHRFRTKITLFFLGGSAISLVTLALAGETTGGVVFDALSLVPFTVLGVLLAIPLEQVIERPRRLHAAVSTLGYASAGVLLLHSVIG